MNVCWGIVLDIQLTSIFFNYWGYNYEIFCGGIHIEIMSLTETFCYKLLSQTSNLKPQTSYLKSQIFLPIFLPNLLEKSICLICRQCFMPRLDVKLVGSLWYIIHHFVVAMQRCVFDNFAVMHNNLLY